MSLDFSRLRRADRLVAAGALALALFMFVFDWFGENINGALPGSDLSGVGGSLTGWQAFTHSRWMWLATVLVALVSVLIRASSVQLPSSIQPGSVVALLGAASVALIVYRIVHHPAASGGFGGFHFSVGLHAGIWLALIAALAITGGGYLQLRAEAPASAADPADRPAEEPFRGLAATSGQAPASAARQPAEEAFRGLTVTSEPAASDAGPAPPEGQRSAGGGPPADAPGDAP